ncbi:hypothetical protein FA95DRAFT_1610876 [Auriscalpium vulgare]|uniref:Uncharacterized protein n=1 Tax=Auriscalpium vulgare TaxID=40419 RepID=A0ACB8RBW5_9AGAM|nr:hypothetical protein FA95DRAFT_1610876 [Auriscalpium vulgare]
MHRCLRISEILDEILECLLADANKGSLAALACTTKMFLEPALNILWRDLNAFTPLICCLPWDLREAWGINDPVEKDYDQWVWYGPANEIQDLTPPPTPDVWERFDFYAKRVRSFHWDNRVGNAAYQLCERHRPSGHVSMPNLVHLTTAVHHWNDFASAVHALGPRLRTLTIIYKASFMALLSSGEFSRRSRQTFDDMRLRCPLMDTVSFQIREEDNVLEWMDLHRRPVNGVSESVCALPPVRSFTTALPITPQAVAALAGMPFLEHVDVALDNTWTSLRPGASAFELPHLPFASLKSLSLSVDHYQTLAPFTERVLAMHPSWQLEDFCIRFGVDGPDGSCAAIAEELHLVLGSLAKASPCNSLRSLEVACTYLPDRAHDHISVLPVDPCKSVTLANLLQPAYVFRNLRRLRIDVPGLPSMVDGGLVDAIAIALPELKCLDLQGFRHSFESNLLPGQ